MKLRPTKIAYIILCATTPLQLNHLNAATSEETSIYIDFGPTETNDAGYTQLSISPTGSLHTFEQSLLNLKNSSGASTDFIFLLNVTNGSRNVAGSNSGSDHLKAAGISAKATTDGIWFNNQNTGTAGGESFGYTLTFTNLDSSFTYNIKVLMGDGTTTNFTWQISTGTGDARTVTITPSTATSEIAEWSNLTPVDGKIVITGLANGPLSGSQVGRLNLVSLTSIANQ